MPSILLPGLKCSKCGYEWRPQKGSTPKVCPECKTEDWDKPQPKG